MRKERGRQQTSAALATSAKPKPPEKSLRLNELAYKLILNGLFERKIPAGAFVSQNDLVRLLGVPIQPLRDALRVLETEGVLRIHPRSGIEFLKADMELVRSTYQFRAIVERAAVRSFAEKGDRELIAALLGEHEAFVQKIEQEGLFKGCDIVLQTLERRMHGSFIESLNNSFIQKSHERLQNYAAIILLDRPETPPFIRRTLQEHIKILQACLIRDADQAEEALTTHFHAALHRFLGL